MAKSPQLQLKAFLGRVRGVFAEAQTSKEMRTVANEAINIIVKRTRVGNSPNRIRVKTEIGEIRERPVKIKALSPGYIQFRKDNKDWLDERTRPAKSNLTFTGQLLDSLRVTKAIRSRAVIEPTGTWRASEHPTQTRNISMKKLAGYVADQGRPFLGLTELDSKKLIRFYRRSFGDLLKKSRIKTIR